MSHNIFIPQHRLGTVVFDVGGVVGDTLSAFTKHAHKHFRLEHRLSTQEVPHYDLREWWASPKQFDEVLMSFEQSTNPYAHMPVVKQADMESVLSIYDHARIIFYTEAPSTSGLAVKDQVRAFLQREGIANPHVEVGRQGLSLGQVCAVYDARAVLDDNPAHLRSVYEHSPQTLPVVYSRLHNSDAQYVRADNIEEFVNLIHAA